MNTLREQTLSFKTELFKAIDAASKVAINGYEIDTFDRTGQEYVLTCTGSWSFKVLDREVTVDEDGQASAPGYERDDWSEGPWEEEDELSFEFRVDHPLRRGDL